MKNINWSQLAMIAGVAVVVVYASNNDVPIFGDKFRKAMNGGTGWL